MAERIGPIIETKGFEQLGILVLDGSGSMSTEGETQQSKADEVNHAVRGLISRLKISNKKENFCLALVTYDNKVNPDRLKPTNVVDIADEMQEDFNPMHGHGGETAIGNALEAAKVVADKFLDEQNQFPRSVVIILMTDGQNNSGQDPVKVAESIKQSGKRIKICAAGYGKGSDVDAQLLQKIVTESNGYVRAYDPEALRKFFEASMTSVVG